MGMILALLMSFTMGFTVTTAHPTNVVVRYKTRCEVGHSTVYRQHQFEAVTPIRRTVTSVPGATECHIRVVAWDRKPWVGHNGQHPVVTSWVT